MGQIKDIGTTQTSISDTTEFVSQEAAGGANSTRKNAWSLFKSTLKTYFDVLYKSFTAASSTKSDNYVILDNDGFDIFYLSGAGANKTFSLPTLADNQNRIITLFNDDSTYGLNGEGEGAETIAGMADIDLPTQGNYITVIGTSTEWKLIGNNLGWYVKASDVKATTTDGGGSAATTWNTREINTKNFDDQNLASIATNQITLKAGTYRCKATAPGYDLNRHKLRIRNITAGTTLITGQNAYTNVGNNEGTIAYLSGKFTLTVQSILEVQHYTQDAKAGNGMGIASSDGGDEIYASVEFWRD